MERRKAIAAASAISISLLSGVVAIGAHLGALGFAGSPSASAPRPPAAQITAALAADQNVSTVADGSADDTATQGRHEDDDHEHSASQAAAERAGTAIGDDDDGHD